MRMIPCKKDCGAEEGEARTPVPALEDAAGVWICAANSLSSSPLLPVPLPTEPRSLPLFSSPRIRDSDSLPKGKNTEGKKCSTVLSLPTQCKTEEFSPMLIAEPTVEVRRAFVVYEKDTSQNQERP